MDYNLLANLQYCKEIVDGLLGFLYYTHIPPAIITLLLGIYVYIKNRSLPSARWLLGLSIAFAFWTTDDLFIWLTYGQATLMMFLWSIIGFLSSLLFMFTFFFIFTFVTERAPPLWLKVLWIVLLVPVVVGAPTALNLTGFDIRDCVAIEGDWYLYYYHALGLLTAIALPFIGIFRNKFSKNGGAASTASILAIIGAEFFIVAFLVTSFVASYLVDAGIVPDFGIEQYGILAMAVFMAFLGYLIVQYRAFDVKILGAQALVIALIIPIASQYAFAANRTNKLLITLTLVLTIFFGAILIRSVRREVQLREHVELLAKDLEKANGQQVTLIHFITHQLKGFVAKSRNIFSMVQEGDYGPVPSTMKMVIDEGFTSATKGAQTIQEILNAANIKSGKVAYANAAFDFKALVDSVIAALKPNADAKGLIFEAIEPEAPVMFTGDQMQMENAIKNMIDNSIKYTPSGSITVTLTQDTAANKLKLVTQDTGVGITPADMQHLFTEGGHGAESQKVNVDSTGFGLYIVKNIIEAHKGKVWAESEGAGKGSKFIVELPLAA